MSTAEQRTLIVVRHAKSDWESGLADFERPLNTRGRRDAPAVGRWLAEQGLSIDAAVVSPAARTSATWLLVAKAAQAKVKAAYDKGIYLGDVDDLADAVRSIDPAARCAVLVGHSPGCHEFVEWVTDGRGDKHAIEQMRTKYPTAAAALLTIEGDWADIDAGRGALLQFAVCRG